MKTKLFLVLAIIGLVFTFAACGDDEDGNWKPMQWSGYSKNKDIVINVDAKGGSNILHCKNYDGLGISEVNETSGDYSKQYYTHTDSTFTEFHFATDWADIQCSGAQLQVVLKPNDSGKERTLNVGVTAGDIFDNIKFIQAAK